MPGWRVNCLWARSLNNEGVAVSRQDHDGTGLFVQAAAADPNDADYHFNLAVSLKRHGSEANAINDLNQCLKLRPSDTEAQTIARGVEVSEIRQMPRMPPNHWNELCAPSTRSHSSRPR